MGCGGSSEGDGENPVHLTTGGNGGGVKNQGTRDQKQDSQEYFFQLHLFSAKLTLAMSQKNGSQQSKICSKLRTK